MFKTVLALSVRQQSVSRHIVRFRFYADQAFLHSRSQSPIEVLAVGVAKWLGVIEFFFVN